MPANDKSTQDYFGHAIILSDTHIYLYNRFLFSPIFEEFAFTLPMASPCGSILKLRLAKPLRARAVAPPGRYFTSMMLA